MGNIRQSKKEKNNFLAVFMSVSFVMLTLIVVLGGYYIFFAGENTKSVSAYDKSTINSEEWDENLPLMKQVADNLNIKYNDKTTVEMLKNSLSRVTDEDVKNITDIILVNQQLTKLPGALEYFEGLKRINLTGNQLLDLPSYLKNNEVEVIADNNILPSSYNKNNQYQLYLLDIMNEEYNNITLSGEYNEAALTELAQRSLWVTASLPKGGHSFSPLNGHKFGIRLFENIDNNQGKVENYINLSTKEIIKEGKIFGEFYLMGSTDENENARFPFEATLVNSKINLVQKNILEENIEITHLVSKNLGIDFGEQITENMLSSLKTLKLENNIEKIPEIIKFMDNLETLDLGQYEDDIISKELISSLNVKSIDLSRAKNLNIIKNIDLPENIKSIDLSYNNLSEVPENILKNLTLENINVSNNHLVVFLQSDDRYNLDGNFLSSEYENQRKIQINDDFDYNISSSSAEEYLLNLLNFINLEKEEISKMKFSLIDSEGLEISEVSESDKDIFLAVNGAKIDNTNAIVKLSKEEKNIVTQEITKENSNKVTIDYDSLKNVLGADTPSTILVNTDYNALIKKEVFQAIKDNSKSLKINVNIKNDNVARYTFTFLPDRVDEAADLNLDFEFIQYQISKEQEKFVKAFNYSGSVLPEGTTLEIALEELTKNEKYYLYSIIKDKAVYSGAVMENSKVLSLAISEAGTYVITNDLLQGGQGNPDKSQLLQATPMNIIIWSLGFIILIAFVFSGGRLFLKKQYRTKMPKNKTYTKEYNNHLISVNNIVKTTKKPQNSFNSFEEIIYNQQVDRKKEENKFEGLENYFGSNTNFSRENNELLQLGQDEKNFKKDKKRKDRMRKNDFDEFKLNL